VIGRNFLTNRKHGRSRAFKQMEEDIMANFPTLVPDSISFDSLVKTVMDIEKFLKDNPDSTAERNPAELVMEFLQGQPDSDTNIRIV
jgi:Fe-S-cluster formation regulator IscX/YfhJ